MESSQRVGQILRSLHCTTRDQLGSVMSSQDSATPPPLPPRFATIRKSYTLPHNMAAAAGGPENRIYDNPVTLRQVIRPRPSSLSVEKRQFLRSASQDNANDRSDHWEISYIIYGILKDH